MAKSDHRVWNRVSRKRWARVRRVVLDRDGWRCQRCHRAGALEVHHKVRVQDGGSWYDLNNLETLCRRCHIEEHNPISAERLAWRALLEKPFSQQI